jgi:hypothetical protein
MFVRSIFVLRPPSRTLLGRDLPLVLSRPSEACRLLPATWRTGVARSSIGPSLFRLLADCEPGDVLLVEQVERLSRLPPGREREKEPGQAEVTTRFGNLSRLQGGRSIRPDGTLHRG